jgi:hypothetical protein
MALPAGTDQTTDTDKSLLAGAAEAELPLVAARHKRGESEHPAGRTEPQSADSGKPTGAARREPHAGT